MPEKIKDQKPPTGFSRLLWRAPIWIYRLGLGDLIKNRMLLLHHTGRVSGQPRQNVLEIVNYDRANGVYYLASGFGTKSDWYKNIVKQPKTAVTVGRKRMEVTAVPLSPEESGQALVEYGKRNPKAAKELMRICGYKVDGSDEDYFIMGRDHIPVIALHPRDP